MGDRESHKTMMNSMKWRSDHLEVGGSETMVQFLVKSWYKVFI
jgi:hypothetical protein